MSLSEGKLEIASPRGNLPVSARTGALPGDMNLKIVVTSAATTFLLVLPLYYFPTDRAAWLLFYASFAVVLFFREVRANLALTLAIWAVLAIHQIIAITNAFSHTVYGADKDAYRFYLDAVRYLDEGVRDWHLFSDAAATYSQLLASSFRLTGTSSLFLGEQFSIMAVALSCVTLVKIGRLLGVGSPFAPLILLFGLIPSSIIYCSVTMREALQSLLTLLLVYWALRLRDRPGLGPIMAMTFVALALGASHHGLAIFALFAVVGAIVWAYGGRARRSAILGKVILGTVIVASLVVALNRGEHYLHALGALQSGRVLEFVDDFRMRTFELDARTNYGVHLNTSSLGSMTLTLFPVVIYYMFAPFPWQVANLSDAVAFAEAALRLILLLSTVVAFRRLRGEPRKRMAFVIFLFALAEGLWALGTVNWGTAIRHHLPAWGLLVVTGGPLLVVRLRALANSLIGHGPLALRGGERTVQ